MTKTPHLHPFWESFFTAALPLSGDVSQVLNPMTFWTKALGNQYGLINIQGKSSNPEMEQKIIAKSGSYGRQLGIINKALYVWAQNVDVNQLKTDEEKLAILSFRKHFTEIEDIKKKS